MFISTFPFADLTARGSSFLKPFRSENMLLSIIDTTHIVCEAGSIKQPSVRLSVCLSVPLLDRRTPLLQVCC